MAQKGRFVFEHDSKKYYEASDPGYLVQNAGNTLDANAVLNQRVTDYLLQGLGALGIHNQFVKQLNMHETLVYDLEALPIKCKVQIRADETHAELLNTDVGAIFAKPLCEILLFKDDKSKAVTFDDMATLGLISEFEIDDLKLLITRVTDYLSGVYWGIGGMLIGFELGFGRQYVDDYHSVLALTDDIAPIKSDIWDQACLGQETPTRLDLSEIGNRLRLIR